MQAPHRRLAPRSPSARFWTGSRSNSFWASVWQREPGSASAMRAAGRKPGAILRLWIGVAVVCTLATMVGFAIADATSGGFQAGMDGFAAGALLVMLVDSMIPEAVRKAGDIAGLVTVFGFAVAAALSAIG
jgi:ZIP family zinc transporter